MCWPWGPGMGLGLGVCPTQDPRWAPHALPIAMAGSGTHGAWRQVWHPQPSPPRLLYAHGHYTPLLNHTCPPLPSMQHPPCGASGIAPSPPHGHILPVLQPAPAPAAPPAAPWAGFVLQHLHLLCSAGHCSPWPCWALLEVLVHMDLCAQGRTHHVRGWCANTRAQPSPRQQVLRGVAMPCSMALASLLSG